MTQDEIPPFQKRGHWLVLRVDGLRIEFHTKPTMAELQRVLGCDCIDTVNLGQNEQWENQVMVVDDTGMLDGKPVNPLATQLYHAMCVPGTVNAIHGDVAVVNDEDFE